MPAPQIRRPSPRVVVPSLATVLILALTVASVVPPAGAHHEAPAPVPAGPRSAIEPVHPPAWSPVNDVSRDCGFSVELRDGKALWIFCDTTDATPTLPGTYFKNNTAAITLPGSPTTLREAVTGSGEPYTFIRSNWYDPCGPYPHIIWPTAATVVPAGPYDRVLVYYENVCVEGPNDITGARSHSIGLAEYLYDPSTNPAAGPIRATILNPELWADPLQFGRAAVHRDGWVYVYQCDWEWGEPWGCRVGRVTATTPQDPGLYQYWTGSGWKAGKQHAAYMTFTDGDTPGVAYQVAWLEEYDVFAMTYIGWPGIGGHQKVRFARQPTGPWTPTITVAIPSCSNDPYWCYAGAIHTQLTGPGELGLSYFDPLVDFSDRPANGQVQSYTQPIALAPPIEHRFSDVWPDHTFFAEIEWMAAAGISDGYPDGTFRPVLPVTREGFAAFLHRLAGSPTGPFPDPGFTDVAPGDPFYTEIAWMAATGLAEGTPAGAFLPRTGLTRQAMAAFLHRAEGSPPGPFPDPGFSDVVPGEPFSTEIAWMAATGRSDGFPDGTYRPLRTVTRQETAAFLARATD